METDGKKPLPDSLIYFDELPDTALIRLPVVRGLLGVSGATVWRWVGTGRLPKPRKMGVQAVGWQVADIRRFLQGTPA